MARYPNYFEKKTETKEGLLSSDLQSNCNPNGPNKCIRKRHIFFLKPISCFGRICDFELLKKIVEQTRFLLTGRIKSLNSTCITILLLSYNLPLHIFTIYLLHESYRKYIQFFQQTLTSWFSHNLISGLFYTYQNRTMRLILSIPNY